MKMPKKMRVYSYSITVLIDAPTSKVARIAQRELNRLIDFDASTTTSVSDNSTSYPVFITAGDRGNWKLEEVRDAYEGEFDAD